ncbi:MAG TPA: TasA family protein [Candidatus Pacearchaeota archaeon]|nr:TasA family protein [Candidatus Pacearchaeota archaeon]
MNKKVIVSLAVIGIVAAVAIGATIAYFSDTETSANNIFTAGTIDLTVDHKYQTYNGVDCHTCGIEIYSDTTDKVIEYNGVTVDPATNAVPVASQYIHSAWTAGGEVTAPSQWIWRIDMAQEDTVHEITAKFQKTFAWQGGSTGATLNLLTAADNGVKAELNGHVLFDRLNIERNFDTDQPGVPVTITVDPSYLIDGQNILVFTVKNFAQTNGTASSNPAALKYYFKVNGNCDSRLELGKNCNLWGEKDLTEGDKFWNFNDIKPGDWGTNLISLHVKSNDAKVCSYLTNATGILGDGINVFAWADDGDGIYEPLTETELYNEKLSGFTGKMYDSTVLGNSTAFMGIAWCAGSKEGAKAVAIDHANTAKTCNPVTMGNEYQEKTFTSDFGFYAVQARHNDTFECPASIPE